MFIKLLFSVYKHLIIEYLQVLTIEQQSATNVYCFNEHCFVPIAMIRASDPEKGVKPNTREYRGRHSCRFAPAPIIRDQLSCSIPRSTILYYKCVYVVTVPICISLVQLD